MTRVFMVIAIAVLAVSCNSRDVGPYAPDAQDRANQQIAAQKAMCAMEDQARCDELIENRLLFARFFAPESFGGMDESEKFRGRSVVTKKVVESVAAIKQCNRVDGETIAILKGMDVAGVKHEVRGTSPLVPQSSTCFISPQPEES